MQNDVSHYIDEVNKIYKTGKVTEHSYRPALQRLLENVTQGLNIINEPKRIRCGAPDYIITRCDIPIGYIEAKDVGENLNDKRFREQFNRYKSSLDNLIITDYLTFQLFKGKNLVTEIAIGKILPMEIKLVPENFNVFAEMIKTFSRYDGKAIKDSQKLAEYMAAKTQLLAEVIEKNIADKDENNSLRQQLKGFQQVLLPTMTDTKFADIYAQTIAYGMFVARLQDSSNAPFTRQHAAELIPQSNPFLRNLFQYIAFNLEENIQWIVDSLADMFNYVDITSIHKEFACKDKDPFLYFYEDFLTQYDKKLKTAMGAYYTPSAVVKFIVQAVDDILKTDFDILEGLADSVKIPVDVPSQLFHRVQILDPATGTGTFLAEVVRKIYQRFTNNAGMWNDYVKYHLIPRLNGFEIMMSPYTMAHLKIEMILQELGATNTERLHIYLTDTLENPKQTIHQIPFAQWLSNEANEAAKIKNNAPVMVILGNPPYKGESTNNGDWIKNLMDMYEKEPQNPSKSILDRKWLNNDYVKFIRLGQHFIEKKGEGILAYITDNSFLDGLTFRGMRYKLLQAFDKIYILNLHGNSRKKEIVPGGSKDENVFDIMQGVSINIFVKTQGKGTNHTYTVNYLDIYGKQQEKYNFLAENNLKKINWKELKYDNDFNNTYHSYFFYPMDLALWNEYKHGFKIDELFQINSQGIVPSNKHFTIQTNKNDLINSINDFLRLETKEAMKKYKLNESSGWSVHSAKKDLTKNPNFNNIVEYSDFPFDIKMTYFTGRSNAFLCRSRGAVMQHFVKGKNLGLVVGKECTDDWKYVFVTKTISSLNLTASASKFGAGFVFPLYLYQEKFGKTEKVKNLNAAIVTRFQNMLPLTALLTSEQIFDYVYAILHSPSYRKRYKEFLKIDFPRVPYPNSTEQFQALAAFGEKLRNLHLMENISISDIITNFPQSGSNKVENSFTEKSNNYRAGKVWINDTQYFDNVPPEAWNFYIGGYQPAQKWLKDRKGRTLSYEERVHYPKIIHVLVETGNVMRDIDKITDINKINNLCSK